MQENQEENALDYYFNRKSIELDIEQATINIKRLENDRQMFIWHIQQLDAQHLPPKSEEDKGSNVEESKPKRLRKTDDQPSRDNIKVQD